MTATLGAILVEEELLAWDSTIGGIFPDLLDEIHEDYRNVTLRQLLSHTGGCPNETAPRGISFGAVRFLEGATMLDRRLRYATLFLTGPPEAEPGTQMIYSNGGYVVAGAMMERVTDTPWEDLLQQRLFRPLGITTAGFGSMGAPGSIDQPWQHRDRGRGFEPIEPGPQSDNPLVIGPAGTVHMSLADWGRFVAAHLEGHAGANNLLKLETWQFLHTAPEGMNYALGWGLGEREWAGGAILSHAGSNTLNYAVVTAAVDRRMAFLVATNIGSQAAQRACSRAALEIGRKYIEQLP
jgi:CubicO group peptidase (beta-lactamase class C family)